MDEHSLLSILAFIARAAAVTMGGIPASKTVALVALGSLLIAVVTSRASMGAIIIFVVSPMAKACLCSLSILRVKFNPIINMVRGVNNRLIGSSV